MHRQLAHDGSGGTGCEGQVLPETEVLVRGPAQCTFTILLLIMCIDI